jgi:CheY-like chemotaxis protein
MSATTGSHAVDPPKLLVADQPAGIALVRRALGGKAIVWGVSDKPSALTALARRVDLIVCGPRFDDSRMFELLREVKADDRFADLPIVCLHSGTVSLPGSTEGFKIACQALGVGTFLDWSELARRVGAEQAERELSTFLLARLQDSRGSW